MQDQNKLCNYLVTAFSLRLPSPLHHTSTQLSTTSMHKHDPDEPPSNPQPLPPLNEPSIAKALVSMFYLALSVAELSLQLGVLAVATTINFIPGPQQAVINHSLEVEVSRSPTSHTTSLPPSPAATALVHLPQRTFRPHYLPLRDYLRLFPQVEAPDAEWFATERMQSEDVDLYDEYGEYDHGLHLEDLTQDDLEMDEAEVAAVTQSTASLTITLANSTPVISAPAVSIDHNTTSSLSSVEPICDNCRAHRQHYDYPHPEMATIDSVGWHCSPPSESRAWFVIAVGRNIGVFDSWYVLSLLNYF